MAGVMERLCADSWIADLHIHSRYSRATARDLEPGRLAHWAARKGIHLLGSGDLTHPGWLEELKERLVPAGEGLFALADADGPEAGVRFLLSGEISCIYKKNQRVRKVHLVVLMPSFEAVERFNERLGRIGNLAADGRPILGLDAKHLLELVLETDPWAELIPAHIWTPWFSVLGSKSGFDSLEECFEELTEYVHAAETGLSSDPPMNWRVESLDRFHLVSSSDAHSPANLGREATLFNTGLSYPEVIEALRTGRGLMGTLEFFPEEGKYHLDGHRKCRMRLDPEETKAWNGLCPVCGKPVTVGVLNRVLELADRPAGERPPTARPYESLLSLNEILGQVLGVGPKTKKVGRFYDRLTGQVGPELFVLRQAPLEDIARAAGPVAAEAVARVRRGEVRAEGGFDGEFGRLTIFTPEELDEINRQGRLFALPFAAEVGPTPKPRRSAGVAVEEPGRSGTPGQGGFAPDEDQEAAVTAPAGPLAIVAGPGSGKTGVLGRRAARLLEGGAVPERILGLTFTRKAAAELSDRLASLAGEAGRRVASATFHALGLTLLEEWGQGREVIDEADRLALIRPLARAEGLRPARAAELISKAKLNAAWAEAICPPGLLSAYNQALDGVGLYDYDDLVTRPLQMIRAEADLAAELAERFDHVLVDEFQDLNPTQFEWLRALAPEPDRSLTAVGDPDQSIYGFTGASPLFFNKLAEDRPQIRVIDLKTSYRCPGPIVAAAAAVIGRNPGRHLELRAFQPDGARLMWAEFASPLAEAVGIVQEIERLVGGTSHLAMASGELDGANNYTLADIAVLIRLHRQAEPLVEALAKAGLPVQVAAEEPGRETDELEFGAEKVTLLTMHAAKGLEFPVVFLAGVEEGLLPYQPPDGGADWEEERRLFYVALTRARERLIITRSKRRSLFGRSYRPAASPFVSEIPGDLVDRLKIAAPRPKGHVQPTLF